jgi:penicillin amidase
LRVIPQQNRRVASLKRLLYTDFSHFFRGFLLRIALRIVGWLLTLTVLSCGGLAWWLFYRPLPQVDGLAYLPGLQGQVTVDRDVWGIPHVRASSLADMAEAQGYVVAQDRLWQMDLLRRVARGQLSEILGAGTVAIDKHFRLLRFGPAAERDAARLDEESRIIMEAYSRGVNKFIEQHQNNLPVEFKLLKYQAQPWQPSDSLVIGAYMYETLTETWEEKFNRAQVFARVGPDKGKDLFSVDAALDHFVVGDPDQPGGGSQRSGDPDDEDDEDDMSQDDVLKAGAQTPNTQFGFTDLTTALAPSVVQWLDESQRNIRHTLGSNNWVVSGDHTATGKPLLANDTHLELGIPPIWYQMHLSCPGWNVKGFTLPGAPLVIIGHNDRIAWGFTNNGADVQDLYIESFNPAQSDEYKANGKWLKAQIVDEVIHVKGAPDEHFPVTITRHGPVVKTDGSTGYALRWTATEPGALANTYNRLGKAQNWKEFREVMKSVWGPAQNAVYADIRGNIGYLMAARVPLRKKGRGELPVPGDTDAFEWKGYIPFDELPQILNPEDGLIVTANARVVGPDYKPYLTDHWEEPYRTARIWDLLHDRHDLRPADMMKVQADTYSYPDVFLAEQLAPAAKLSAPKDPRTQKLIALAKDWNGIADPDSIAVPFLEATRRATLKLILQPALGADTNLYQWRSTAFLQRVLTERPPSWLPSGYKNYDELLVAAADESVQQLEKDSGSPKIENWPWKRFDSLEMLHPLGREGWLKKLFSITGKPQGGTAFSPRAATRHHGPAMRFVANPGNWDDSLMLIPAGQSGQLGSSHYSDQFRHWYEGIPILAPFSDSAQSATRKHTLTLKP